MKRDLAQLDFLNTLEAAVPPLPPRTSEPASALPSETFTPIDRHFARFIERLDGGNNPALALAAALVSRSRGDGNVCVDLRALAGSPLSAGLNGPHPPNDSLPELTAWLGHLRGSSVVGRPGEFKPLVLDSQDRLYLHRYWQYESNLAADLLARAQRPCPGIDPGLLQRGLDRFFPKAGESGDPDWQRLAARTAVERNLCVISGGPGTGKTRTVGIILALLLEQTVAKPLRIALTAPTGKAAARLQESLKSLLAGLPCDPNIRALMPTEASTVHRLLGGLPGAASFQHNAENPLPFDVVVIDEASMVDLALMAKLFAAVPRTARIILLGDKDQLASVEAGAVLGDICGGLDEASSSPPEQVGQSRQPLTSCIVHLRRNYRFAAGDQHGILDLSQAINAGDVDRVLHLLTHEKAAEGIRGVTLPPAQQLKAALREPVLAGFETALQARDPLTALQALNRFRILAAIRQGPFGVVNLNQLVEEILAEARLISPRTPWYAGRPVMVTRNDYNLKLFNGDIGIVLPDKTSGEPRVWFTGPENAPRAVLPMRLSEHETVFAMTVHKSQGSEFENVLFVLPERESPVLTRELIYTGVTRARSQVEIWFAPAILRAAISRRVERASGLRDALWPG